MNNSRFIHQTRWCHDQSAESNYGLAVPLYDLFNGIPSQDSKAYDVILHTTHRKVSSRKIRNLKHNSKIHRNNIQTHSSRILHIQATRRLKMRKLVMEHLHNTHAAHDHNPTPYHKHTPHPLNHKHNKQSAPSALAVS